MFETWHIGLMFRQSAHEEWHASDFILIFSKWHNSRKGDNSVKKKNVSAIFPWRIKIHLWNLKTLAYMVHKIWHAYFELMHAQTDARTDNWNQYALSTSSKLGA